MFGEYIPHSVEGILATNFLCMILSNFVIFLVILITKMDYTKLISLFIVFKPANQKKVTAVRFSRLLPSIYKDKPIDLQLIQNQ